MKKVRVKISSDFMKKIGAPDFLEAVTHLEIVSIYQYDRQNFFSLQKFQLKPEYRDKLDEVMKKYFKAMVFQPIEQKPEEGEYLAIIRQNTSAGFWNILIPGQWGLIPPVSVDQDFVMLTIISNEELNPDLFKMVGDLAEKVELISIEKFESPDELFGNAHGVPLSKFTSRQREIAVYATRKGYFETPKKISAKEIAEHFQISESAVTEHLRKVERFIMKYIFG